MSVTTPGGLSEADDPMPARATVETILARIQPAGGALDPADLAELMEAARWALHALPPGMDFSELTTRNPLNQVYFRAGLLACREYMARFVEQGGDTSTAASIRANWWPSLGDDPGPPRLFDFDELVTESENPDGSPRWTPKEVPTSVEALPRAHAFLHAGHLSISKQNNDGGGDG